MSYLSIVWEIRTCPLCKAQLPGTGICKCGNYVFFWKKK